MSIQILRRGQSSTRIATRVTKTPKHRARAENAIAFCFAIEALEERTLFSGPFSIGERVTMLQSDVIVRSTPAGSTIVGMQTINETGSVTGGPSVASLNGTSYTWYDVNWDAGPDGWSADIYIGALPAPTLISPGTSSAPGPVLSTLTPTLAWNAVTGATSYGVYVKDTASDTFVYDNDSVGDITSLQLLSGTLQTGHSYAWNVRVNESSNYASPYYFQVEATPTISSVAGASNPIIGSNSSQTLSIFGTGFSSSSTAVLREPALSHTGAFTSSPISATYISSTELQIPATLGADAVTWTAQVTSSGGTSSQFSFNVDAPTPTIISLSPSSATAGGSAFTLTVNGNTFEQASSILWSGSSLPTTSNISGGLVTSLYATVSAADIATSGAPQVTVYNPGPGGGTSTSASFNVQAGTPTISGVAGTSNPIIGSNSPQTLTITGTDFTSTSTIVLREPALSYTGAFTSSPISATYVNSTELQIPATLGADAIAWTAQVTSNGGTSSQFSFNVDAPAPTIISLSPSSRNVGGSAFTLTVSGSTFEQDSSILWNGTDLSTTPQLNTGLVTALQATIPSSDIATTGTAQVAVYNPGPGGGTSIAQTFNISTSSPPSGIDPNNMGKGDWIYSVSAAEANVGVSSVQALVDYEKSEGVQWLVVKCGDGNYGVPTNWTQFSSALISDCHADDINIFGYVYVYGGGADPYGPSTVSGEIAVAENALALNPDGLIIDWEAEYEALGDATAVANAEQYCQAIRAEYPNAFLATAPIWDPLVNLPDIYRTFNEYCNAVMPQAYCSENATTQTYLYHGSPDQMMPLLDADWTEVQNEWISQGYSDAVKPIVPIAYGAAPVTGSEINEFVSYLKNDASPATAGGYNGISFFDADAHDASIWSAIASNSIGNQPANSPDTPINLLPADGATDVSLTPALTATAFSDPSLGGTQMAAEWIVTRNSDGATIFDDTDTVNLTSWTPPSGPLVDSTLYNWKVRYEDNYGAWSNYSTPTTFMTVTPPWLVGSSGAGYTFSNQTLTITGGTVTFTADASSTLSNLNVMVANGAAVIFDTSQHLATLDLTGGSAAFGAEGQPDGTIAGDSEVDSAAAPSSGNVLVVSSLSITEGGTLDLTNNDMIVHNGTLGTFNTPGSITNLIAQGYHATGPLWIGTGITSSTAAASTTMALGVELNDNGSGTPLMTTFDGETVTNTDLLVKFTYFGDANLDGVVNGSDYTLIDNGFNAGLSGWRNGDFNYDGAVNGNDYLLIDNVYNTQSDVIPAAIPAQTVAPTPTSQAAKPAEVIALATSPPQMGDSAIPAIRSSTNATNIFSDDDLIFDPRHRQRQYEPALTKTPAP